MGKAEEWNRVHKFGLRDKSLIRYEGMPAVV